MNIFESKELFIQAAGSRMVDVISTAVNEFQHAYVLLSGGSTPGPIYRYVAEHFTQLDSVKIGLVDERFVPLSNPHSNEALIRKCFDDGNDRSPDIIGMVYNISDAEQNLESLKTAYAPFRDRMDLLVLGMGLDGHFASIFPGDPSSDQALVLEDLFFNTTAPSEPKNRITMSFSFIQKAKSIFLFISGEEKYAILKDRSLNLPIHHLLSARPDVQIFYTKES